VNSKKWISEDRVSETNNNILLSTTTPTIYRGFALELLNILKEGSYDVSDLREITGKYRQYLNWYLYRLRNAGYVTKNGQFWKITEEGISFINKKNKVYKNHNIHMDTKEERRNRERIEREKKLSLVKPKQISLSLYLKKFSLSDVEKVVVEYLVDHYNKTGSKFIYIRDIYELAEKLDVNPAMLQPAITNLKQDRIVWLYRDRVYRRWKLGLYKAFVETLKKLHM